MKRRLPLRRHQKQKDAKQGLGDELLALAVGAASGKIIARLLPKRLRRLGVFAVPPVTAGVLNAIHKHSGKKHRGGRRGVLM